MKNTSTHRASLLVRIVLIVVAVIIALLLTVFSLNLSSVWTANHAIAQLNQNAGQLSTPSKPANLQTLRKSQSSVDRDLARAKAAWTMNLPSTRRGIDQAQALSAQVNDQLDKRLAQETAEKKLSQPKAGQNTNSNQNNQAKSDNTKDSEQQKTAAQKKLEDLLSHNSPTGNSVKNSLDSADNHTTKPW